MSSLATEPEQRLAEPRENAARVVWALAWPAVALNSLQTVNILLDRAFIGRLEPSSLTALGAATNVLFLMFSVAMAIGTASTAIVSRAFGAGDEETWKTATRQSVSISLAVGGSMALLCWFFAPLAASSLLPATDLRAQELMIGFLRLYAIGLPAIYVIQALAGALRGAGDTRSPMTISGLQILLHIVLNFLLIFPTRQIGGVSVPGFGMGLMGAGLALSLSATLAAVVYLAYSGKTVVGEAWRTGLPSWSWIQRVMRIATPAAMQSVLRVASLAAFTLALAEVVNRPLTYLQQSGSMAMAAMPGFGVVSQLATPLSDASIAIAAMSVGFAIESIMFMPGFGLSVAAASLVGQSLGMKRPDRAAQLGWTAGHHAGAVTLLLAIPIFFLADPIAHLLVEGSPAIAAEAANLIRILCVTEIMFGYAMALIGAMQGAGDTVSPLWITIVCMWVLRVPLAFVLALPAGAPLLAGLTLPIGFDWGATGAWWAMSFTQAVQGILAIVLFAQGRWKAKRV